MSATINRRTLLRTMGLVAGVSLSPSCRRALESGADLGAPPAGGRLSDAQLEVITVLTDLIIPRTDTPGAVEAGVPAFIHSVVVDWYTPAERQIFLSGLAELERSAEQNASSRFVDLDRAQQARILSEMEPPSEGGADGLSLAGAMLPAGAPGELPFTVKLKELTVLGYYTSEAAAGTELDYRPVPGRYEPDAQLPAPPRQWIR